MTRISSTLSGVDFTLQNNIQRAFVQLGESSLRLATLRQVNRGSDDPAGLIAIGQIEAELAALEQADENAARAESIVNVADSALGQVSSLLNDLHGHVVAAAGDTLTDEQRAAHQIEVDAALDAINRIGQTTSLGGRNLLDGSASELSFVVSADISDAVTLNLPTVSTSALGSDTVKLDDLRSGGRFALTNANRNGPAMQNAAAAIAAAARQVTHARGSAGAFARYTLDSSRAVAQSAFTNLSAAVSSIRDTDVAAETARFVQARIRRDSSLGAAMLAARSTQTISQILDGAG